MAGLYAPLPTLRRRPRGRLRTARGRCGSLLLHRSGLSPPTACRSPGALTRVAARTLARSPICDQLHRRLQPFRHLHDCSGCFRLERLPGGACTHWKAPPSHGAHVERTFRIGAVGVAGRRTPAFPWRPLEGRSPPEADVQRDCCGSSQRLFRFGRNPGSLRVSGSKLYAGDRSLLRRRDQNGADVVDVGEGRPCADEVADPVKKV